MLKVEVSVKYDVTALNDIFNEEAKSLIKVIV